MSCNNVISSLQDICFVAADVRGVFANVFTDFGPNFEVLDKDDTQVLLRF